MFMFNMYNYWYAALATKNFLSVFYLFFSSSPYTHDPVQSHHTVNATATATATVIPLTLLRCYFI